MILEYLESFTCFECSLVTNAPEVFVKHIWQRKVDVCIINILSEQKEAEKLLHKFSETEKPKELGIIALTSIEARKLTTYAGFMGIDYFIKKPFSLDNIANRIVELYNKKFDKEIVLVPKQKSVQVLQKIDAPEKFALKVLYSAGIKNNLNGYEYLKTAVVISVLDPLHLESFTKILYPEVAKIHKTTPKNVERAIRAAIDDAWNGKLLQKYLTNIGMQIDGITKMTNTRFIKIIVESYQDYINS